MITTPEHEHFRAVVRDLVETEINPHVDAWEDAGIFPAHELFPKLAAIGALGLEYDPEYGGPTAPACRWGSPCRSRWRRPRSPATAATS
jgi:citronellyl-CoA dehydrogenase